VWRRSGRACSRSPGRQAVQHRQRAARADDLLAVQGPATPVALVHARLQRGELARQFVEGLRLAGRGYFLPVGAGVTHRGACRVR
jgi:hypothetical protein